MSQMPAQAAQSPVPDGARRSPAGTATPCSPTEPSMPTPNAMTNGRLITSHPSAGPLPAPKAPGVSGGGLSAARGGQCSAPPSQHGKVVTPARPSRPRGGPVPGC